MILCEQKPMDGIAVLKIDTSEECVETYNFDTLKNYGIEEVFVQENQSMSKKNVLRGMHFQQKFDQAQIVRVLKGKVYDVVVDIREHSSTFGEYFGIYLSQESGKMIYMSKGFAHGFLTLSDEVIMHYKCSEFYHPEDESGIRFDDPIVNINWPIDDISKLEISSKDMNYLTLTEYANEKYKKD